MHIKDKLIRLWAWSSIVIVLGMILFLFGYVFARGGKVISWEFLTKAPSGAVLGMEGGIFPAIMGSFAFTLTAVVIGGIPAIAAAIFTVFYCSSNALGTVLKLIIECIAGIPSIVLGLFSYSLFVRDLQWGRCILSASMALGIMVMPFIEVRAEKAFRELPRSMIEASYALGCSRFYTIVRIVLPACRGELVSGVILGACYAMGATAPMIFTGAVAFAKTPASLMQPAMALPLHLYLLIAQGATSLDTAFGTAFVMMAIILISNILATFYARRRSGKWNRS